MYSTKLFHVPIVAHTCVGVYGGRGGRGLLQGMIKVLAGRRVHIDSAGCCMLLDWDDGGG